LYFIVYNDDDNDDDDDDNNNNNNNITYSIKFLPCWVNSQEAGNRYSTTNKQIQHNIQTDTAQHTNTNNKYNTNMKNTKATK